MKVIYTNQSLESLYEALSFLLNKQGLSLNKVIQIRKRLLDKADSLKKTYNQYQEEEYLKHLQNNYRRAIEGYFKIIYRVEGDNIYIIDFFDTRQSTSKMKS